MSLGRRVVMDTPHVIVQVPSTRESISGNGSFTTLPEAQVRVVSVAVESVGFTLVPEETCIRGETQLGFHAGGNLAAVGLQVGIQVFTEVC